MSHLVMAMDRMRLRDLIVALQRIERDYGDMPVALEAEYEEIETDGYGEACGRSLVKKHVIVSHVELKSVPVENRNSYNGIDCRHAVVLS